MIPGGIGRWTNKRPSSLWFHEKTEKNRAGGDHHICRPRYDLVLSDPTQSVLVAGTVKPDKTVLCARMIDGEEWMISYVHSVNRRPVFDFLRIEGKGLRSYGRVSTPSEPGCGDVHSGKSSPYRSGRMARIHSQSPGADITIFVGRVAGHALHIKGQEIPSPPWLNQEQLFGSPWKSGRCIRLSKENVYGDGQGSAAGG